MNPIYRFFLSLASGMTSFRSFPVYTDDLSKEFERQSGQQFFREKLSGKLIYEKTDYQRIVNAAFDEQFYVTILISYDGGQTWASYWMGTFWKTDCEFDGDAQTVSVTPTVWDRYYNVLAGMEKEFNLISLTPEIAQIKADKRPMIQVYAPGQTTVGCFLSGMWWEQECEAVGEYEYIRIDGRDINKLTEYMHFHRSLRERFVELSGTFTPAIPNVFWGAPYYVYASYQTGGQYDAGGYRFKYTYYPETQGDDPQPDRAEWEIIRLSDNTRLFYHGEYNPPLTVPQNVTLAAVPGSGATGTINLYIYDQSVYARLVCDTTSINGTSTFQLPADDMVANNRNYHYVIGYDASNDLYYTAELTSTPTQWGIYQPGQYYQPPYIVGMPIMYPVARNTWTQISLWFSFSQYSISIERAGRAAFQIKDAYPLASVISVLLGQIAPNITFDATDDYSEFLYGSVNIGNPPALFITPKSNIISSGYDQPAQTAPITLKDVLDMLRDCFRCYWFIDSENRLRIEHIRYFLNGGSYTGTPIVGIDLTQQKVLRNGKQWAFARNQYTFEKPEMAARYQFAWMDEVTQLFKGYPIDIISKYVDPERIEQINVIKFTSDIDYILLNPGDISKDGFVLLGAQWAGATLALPYYTYTDGIGSYNLQNGALAFCFLQNYYAYDMPARDYAINGVSKVAAGLKKLKNQSISFPVATDPHIMQLVKTELGDGVIEKMSVNLSSRNAKVTLKYDTE